MSVVWAIHFVDVNFFFLLKNDKFSKFDLLLFLTNRILNTFFACIIYHQKNILENSQKLKTFFVYHKINFILLNHLYIVDISIQLLLVN